MKQKSSKELLRSSLHVRLTKSQKEKVEQMKKEGVLISRIVRHLIQNNEDLQIILRRMTGKETVDGEVLL
jgi:hypothetical protein